MIANTIIGLVYTPFLLRFMGQSEFGLYSLTASVIGYLTILDFGFGNAIIRYTAKFLSEKNYEKLSPMFGMFFVLYSIMGLVAFSVGLILFFNVDFLFGKTMTFSELEKSRIMMMLLTFNIAVTFPLSIFGSIISAHEEFVFQKSIHLIRIFLQPCIMVPLLLLGYKAIAMVILITILNITSLVINYIFCIKRLKIKIHFREFDTRLLKEIFNYSIFVFIGLIIDKIYWSTGQFIVGSLIGTSAVAVYSIAMQLQGYYIGFSIAISGVFLPKVTAMITGSSSEQDISRLFVKIGRLQFIVLGFVLSGFIVFGKLFILIWAGRNYTEAYNIGMVIMIPLTLPLIQNLGITILQARNQQKFRSFLYIAIAIFSLIISIPLTKKYGILGCATGTSAALVLGNVLIINIYYQKVIKLNIIQFWNEIFRMALPMTILIIAGLYLNSFSSYDTIISFIWKFSLFSAIYVIITWNWGMNSYEKDLIRIPIIKLINRWR